MRERQEWWKLEGDALHTCVFAAAQELQQHDPRVSELVAWNDLYCDEARQDWTTLGLFRDRRSRYNVVQSGVDTVVAKLGKSRTRPWIVTTNGDWEARSRAKLSTLWLDGQFEALELYKIGQQVLQDAAIFGAGAAKFYERDGRPCVDLVWTGDLFVDRAEERHRCVRTLYQVAGYDKGVLAAEHPEHREAIVKATAYEDPLLSSRGKSSDLVLVVEVWRLPDGPDDPGRHCIAIDGACLVDEKWTRKVFPFEFLHWARRPMRFWGQGLVERLSGGQAQLNRIAATLEDAYEHCPPATLWCESEAQIDVKRIDNSPWKVHTFASGAQPPYVLTPQAISADFTAREEALISRMYALAGISEMSAQSVKPAGLNSGKAMLVHQDVESERFYPQAKSLEDWYVGAAKHLLAIADEVLEGDDEDDEAGEYSEGEDRDEEDDDEEDAKPRKRRGRREHDGLTCYGGDKALEQVSYVDAQLGDRPHVMRVFPVSSLATSPQGRLQQVADLMQLGILTDTSAARELLEFPDLDRYNSVESAGRELVDRRIGEALKGQQVSAHPLMPLDYVVRKGTLEHDLAELQGADDDALQCLRDFIAMAQSLMAAAAPPPPPESPAMQGAPMPGMPPDPTGGAMPPSPEMGIAS